VYRGSSNDATPFFIAARNGDVDLMQLLVAGGADPKIPTSQGVTPLMAAAGTGQNALKVTEAQALAAVKLCVELGNDVNARSTSGETALHGAAFRENENSIHIVQFLVDHGAKVNVMDDRGWTPLTVAEGLGFAAQNTRNPETAALLQMLGAIPSPPDYDRNTGLYFEEILFPPGTEPSGSSPNIQPALPGTSGWKAPVIPDRKTRAFEPDSN
jgi:ankyrin repeat protein